MNPERLDKIVKLVKNQTDYTDDEIHQQLEQHNYDYLEVIRNYMGITEKTSSYKMYNSINNNSSVNQKIYYNIRNFMDNNVKQYELRKKILEERQYLEKKEQTD